MEVEPAALTVHAPIYTASTSDLDINGDFTLRDNFHTCMKKIFAMSNFKPKKILDIGCSTGLSTLKLHDSFPGAEIIGMDLSPYMLAGTLHNCFLSLFFSFFQFYSLRFYSLLLSLLLFFSLLFFYLLFEILRNTLRSLLRHSSKYFNFLSNQFSIALVCFLSCQV